MAIYTDGNKLPKTVPSPSTVDNVVVQSADEIVNLVLQDYGNFLILDRGKRYRVRDGLTYKEKIASCSVQQLIDDGRLECGCRELEPNVDNEAEQKPKQKAKAKKD